MFPVELENVHRSKLKAKSTLDINILLKSIDSAFDLYIGVTISKPGMHTYLVTHGENNKFLSFKSPSATTSTG